MTERAFSTDTDGTRWYKTGDIVMSDDHGDYKFLGRRDRMIKKRGYRIELDEIECCLYRHSEVEEAAVVATSHEKWGVRPIRAHLGTKGGKRLSLVELKQFCSERYPSIWSRNNLYSTTACRRHRPARSITGCSRRTKRREPGPNNLTASVADQPLLGVGFPAVGEKNAGSGGGDGWPPSRGDRLGYELNADSIEKHSPTPRRPVRDESGTANCDSLGGDSPAWTFLGRPSSRSSGGRSSSSRGAN